MKADKNTIRSNHHRHSITLIMLITFSVMPPAHSNPVNIKKQKSIPYPLFLVLMHGVSGSGKSTLARWLEQETGAIWISSDIERKRLFKLKPEENSAEKGLSIYTAKANFQTFRHIERLTNKYLKASQSIILDATFLHPKHRQPYLKLAKDFNARTLIISCDAPKPVLLQRVRSRKSHGLDPSEATESIVKAQLSKFQPIPVTECAVTYINTAEPVSGQQQQIKEAFKKILEL